jgi:Ig-like domain from next to BRCA1 gene
MIKKARLEKSDSASGESTAAPKPTRESLTAPADRSPEPDPAVTTNAMSGPRAAASFAIPVAEPGEAAPDGERREHKFQLKLTIIGGVFAVVAGIAGALAAGAFTSSGGQAASSSSFSSSSSTAPRVPGDGSAFIRDVTYPDYSDVQANEHFTKIWELEDTGTVTWTGRYLAALGPSSGKCTYPARVRIPTTDPGDPVNISVKVTAAASPGLCYVTWRMVTSSGELYFPGDTSGIWFKVNVVAAKASG